DSPVKVLFTSTLPISVSSACRPVPRSAQVAQCPRCGLLQKTDQSLLADYRHYDQYDNDPACDKIVRRPGQPDRTRSELVADLLIARSGGNRPRRILDVGCHRGAFLAALRARAPEIELHGFDLDPDYARWIEPICGRGRYHSGALSAVPGGFDACVLIHTLEHVPRPRETLRTVRQLLSTAGLLIVVVPNVAASQSDFYLIDHCSHYTLEVLHHLVGLAGFSGAGDPDVIGIELV